MNYTRWKRAVDRLERLLDSAFWICVGCVPLVAGCSWLNTRPGHPDSWNTPYYDPTKEWKSWSVSHPDAPASAGGAGTPTYQVATTAIQIWNKRGYAHNLSLRYRAAYYKAQDRQDQEAVPLFGAAIGTAAVALAGANPYVIGGTALGGAALGGGAAYLQPGRDASTDLTAHRALNCVVNESGILNNMPAIALALDRAAIRDALAQLRTDAAGLSTATAAGQALKSAATAVDASAETTIQQLDAAIAQYLQFPQLIQTTADNIDDDAMAGGARSLDYSSLVQNIKGAQTSQNDANDAKNQVKGAKVGAASATEAASAAGAAGASQVRKLNPPGGVTSTPKLNDAASAVAGVAAAAVAPASAAATDATPALDATSKQDSLSGVLTSPAYNDMTRVTVLSTGALDDLPNPNYSTTAVNIQACWPVK